MAFTVSEELVNTYWEMLHKHDTLEVGIGHGPDELPLEQVSELAYLLDGRCEEYTERMRDLTDCEETHCWVRFYSECSEAKAEFSIH